MATYIVPPVLFIWIVWVIFDMRNDPFKPLVSSRKKPRELSPVEKMIATLPEPPRDLEWTFTRFPIASRLGLRRVGTDQPLIALGLRTHAGWTTTHLHLISPFTLDTSLEMRTSSEKQAMSFASQLLLDFAYATGALEHMPTWVGPDQSQSFHVTVPRSVPEVTPRVRIGRLRSRPYELNPLTVDARDTQQLDVDLILAIWPSWAEEHLYQLRQEARRQHEREQRRQNYETEERLEMSLKRITRTPQPSIEEQFAALEPAHRRLKTRIIQRLRQIEPPR